MSVVFFLVSIGVMSPVNFKKCLCHPVEFKGQGPILWGWGEGGDGMVWMGKIKVGKGLILESASDRRMAEGLCAA